MKKMYQITIVVEEIEVNPDDPSDTHLQGEVHSVETGFAFPHTKSGRFAAERVADKLADICAITHYIAEAEKRAKGVQEEETNHA